MTINLHNTTQCVNTNNYMSCFQMLVVSHSEFNATLLHIHSTQAADYRSPPRFFAPPHLFQRTGSAGNNPLYCLKRASAEAENKVVVGESKYRCQKEFLLPRTLFLVLHLRHVHCMTMVQAVVLNCRLNQKFGSTMILKTTHPNYFPKPNHVYFFAG